MMKRMTFLMTAAVAAAVSAGASPKPLAEVLRAHVAAFNAADEELYTNAVPNADAAAFLLENVPLFECPDEAITRTYYFRWWTFRKHLRQTPDGWVVTEFLPNVGWAGKHNTISCPFGHHLCEGRWLRDARFVDDYLRFMVSEGSINGRRAYATWPAWGACERAKITGDEALLVALLPRFVANYEAWEKGWPSSGVSLRDVENRQGARGRPYQAGFRSERGLFDFVGTREGTECALSVDGARPMVNAAMWAEATSIAAIARIAGRADLAAVYAEKAAVLRQNILARLWNPSVGFYTALSADGELDDVCELHGYAPFYFGLPQPASRYGAFAALFDAKGFAAPKGLAYVRRDTPGFDLSRDLSRHECLWNGPSWPYATSVALTALYGALQAAPSAVPLKADDFAALLHQYAAQQVLTRPDGRVVPWIDENLDPMTGAWIARDHMIAWDRAGIRPLTYAERGKDYNHSTFCDLVIAGLCGLCPQADGTLQVRPLAPSAWAWWKLARVRFRGRDVTVLYDRDGTRYGCGKGLVVLDPAGKARAR